MTRYSARSNLVALVYVLMGENCYKVIELEHFATKTTLIEEICF